MQILKSSAKLFLVLVCVLGFAASASAQVTWTFSDITFNNGDAVTGSFTTNSAVTMVDSFNVTITGPDAFTVVGLVDSYLPGEIGIYSAGFSQYIDLYPASPLTNAGGTIAITQGYDCPGCGTLNGETPEITGVTPEVPTGGLMLLGFGLLFGTHLIRRSRRPILATR
jgi:hypothetical protein